jgi:hypothetical protein
MLRTVVWPYSRPFIIRSLSHPISPRAGDAPRGGGHTPALWNWASLSAVAQGEGGPLAHHDQIQVLSPSKHLSDRTAIAVSGLDL